MYTWVYRGCACAAPVAVLPRACSARRCFCQRHAAGGGGCASSISACRCCTARRHQRGDALEPVGRKRAPKAHAPIHHHCRAYLPVSPRETLRPQVRMLDRAKAVRALRVRHVGHRVGRTTRSASVTPVFTASSLSEAGVGGDPGLLVVLHADLAAGPSRYALASLHHHVGWMQPAGHVRKVGHRWRDPAFAQIRVHRGCRRHRLRQEAGVVESED
eukprot:6183557-Pleurochrysis_carterae.AAC.3